VVFTGQHISTDRPGHLTAGPSGVKMPRMKRPILTCVGVESGCRPWRVYALAVVLLLMSSLVGSGYHSAGHIHGPDKAGDCGLCTLSQQFVAVQVSAPILMDGRPNTTETPVCLRASSEEPLRSTPARAPPVILV